MSHFVVTRVLEAQIEIDPEDNALRMPDETDEELALSIVNALPYTEWQLVGANIEFVQ